MTTLPISLIEQFTSFINDGEVEECKRLYQLIDVRPIEIVIPKSYGPWNHNTFNVTLHRLVIHEKMELVWPSINNYIKPYNRLESSETLQYVNQLLIIIIKYGYLLKDNEFIANLSIDPSIIESMRRIGWTVTVRGCRDSMEDLMEVKNIAANIMIEFKLATPDKPFDATIHSSKLLIIEYLNLRSIEHKTIPLLYLPVLEDAPQDREKLIVYLQHYHHHSSEFNEQLISLTTDEIIRCQNDNLIKMLIELKVELPSLNMTLTALLEANVPVNKMTKMFLAIAHHNPETVNNKLIKRLIEGLDQHKQEYGAVLVVIARYKLACLEEYREIEFIHHLLELTISKTKSFREYKE